MSRYSKTDVNWKKNIIIILSVLFLLALAMVYIYTTHIQPAMHTNKITIDCDQSKYTLCEFKQGDTLNEVFVSPEKEVYGIDLRFQKEGTGDALINVKLSDFESGELYYEKDLTANEIVNNKFIRLALPEENALLNTDGQKFNLTLYVKSIDDSLKLSMRETTDKSIHSAVSVNGVERNVDIDFRIVGSENVFLKPLYLLLCATILIIVMLFYYLAIIKKMKIEKLFLIFSILFGLVYMFVFPPFSIPDEFTHIGSAYRYSNVLLGYGFGGETYTEIRTCDFSSCLLNDITTADSYRYIMKNFLSVAPNSDTYPGVIPYAGNICQYIFTTLGVTIARICHLGYLPMLYLGRIFNFAFFVTLVYISIKRIPIGKMLISAVALMPVTMMFAVSFSYDTVIIALAIFYISNVIYMAYGEQPIRWYDVLLLCVAGGFLTAGKAGVYIFVCLTALIIPMKKFKSKPIYFASIAAIALSCIVFMVVFNLSNVIGVGSKTAEQAYTQMTPLGTVESNHTLSDIFTHSQQFLDCVVNTLNKQFDSITLSMLGQKLSWLNVIIPFYIIIPIIIVLLFASIKTEEEQHIIIKTRTKGLFVAISLIVLFAFMIVAYTWTSTSSPTISGVHGRYFIPILPLVLFCLKFDNLTFKKNINHKLYFTLALISAMTLLETFKMFVIKDTIVIR